jgi:hypothetical protein
MYSQQKIYHRIENLEILLIDYKDLLIMKLKSVTNMRISLQVLKIECLLFMKVLIRIILYYQVEDVL